LFQEAVGMSDSIDNSDAALAEFLQQRGHSEEEIEKIVKRLAEHDAESMRQSIFDSIAGGSFNLDEIIQQALED
jgi:predicted DNA-binding protein (UPF0278 family)